MLLVVGSVAGCTPGAADVGEPEPARTRADRSGSGGSGLGRGAARAKLEPGTTAIFRGGPATGPWQQIGSVAEITHPRAAPTARMSYDENWAARGLPNELWDELAARVSLQLVKLGPPADRPTFNGAPGSEPFNSYAGVDLTEQQTSGPGLLVSFMGTYLAGNNVATQANYPFLVGSSDYSLLAPGPRVDVSERRSKTRAGATDRYYKQVMTWLGRTTHPSVQE